ncbi:MAG: hypothetical protein EP336_09490 [Rhodobacteraceae bacterium]|nr:MAG: hypothetical protein EP336_09490 [Paracoccaceae bacterium]
MLAAVRNFLGQIPAVDKRLLAEGYSQFAENVELLGGTLRPYRGVETEHTFETDVQTIYKNGAIWLGWDAQVSVAPAPVATDRVYYTGDGTPKMLADGTVYPLALPAPTTAPTVTLLSAFDPELSEYFYYAYTFVTAFGEESAPSPLSAMFEWSSGVVCRVEGFDVPVSGRNITKIRLYKSQTSASGVTAMFFASEFDVTETSYDHDAEAEPLAEQCATTEFDTPPDGLRGLTVMPNGMMAAFDGKELWFCEPYQPHAWPSAYSLVVDSDIVGLAAFGSTLAIVTQGTPHIVQGTHPESMVMEKMESNLPCLSARGIVDLGYAAAYPSTEGLVIIQASSADVVTRNLFTRDQWRELSPESFVAAAHAGRYMFTYAAGEKSTVYDGGIVGISDDPVDVTLDGGADAGLVAGWVSLDFGAPESAFSEQRLGEISVSQSPATFQSSDISVPVHIFTDTRTSETYLLDSDHRTVLTWNALGAPRVTGTWKSSCLTLSVPNNFGAIRIRTATPVLSEDTFFVTVIADGVVKAKISKANQICRLPAGFKAIEWEFVITSSVEVTSIALANTPLELQGAA